MLGLHISFRNTLFLNIFHTVHYVFESLVFREKLIYVCVHECIWICTQIFSTKWELYDMPRCIANFYFVSILFLKTERAWWNVPELHSKLQRRYPWLDFTLKIDCAWFITSLIFFISRFLVWTKYSSIQAVIVTGGVDCRPHYDDATHCLFLCFCAQSTCYLQQKCATLKIVILSGL